MITNCYLKHERATQPINLGEGIQNILTREDFEILRSNFKCLQIYKLLTWRSKKSKLAQLQLVELLKNGLNSYSHSLHFNNHTLE